MKQKYYYLAIPESGEQFYFAVGPSMRQLRFKDQELTLTNTIDCLPEEGSELWDRLEECTEDCFNYWWQGAIVCLNSINWGQDPNKKNVKKV